MTPKEIMEYIKRENIEFLDLRFMDFPGMWQHTTIPANMLDESVFEDGLGFDGSSIRGWQAINESDMILVPDPETMVPDPFTEHPTIIMICDIKDPITREDYTKDPRHIAKKATKYLQSTGLGDTVYIGPEAEFFVFDSVRYDSKNHYSFLEIDSIEGIWNSGKEEEYGNLGYKIRHKEGYFPVPPTDKLHDLRSEMVKNMIKMGLKVEVHHHEVATAGQCEIDIRFDELVRMADKLQFYKYAVKNTAYINGKTATFMPKPMFDDNGSGMHTHISIWKNGKNTFAGNEYAGLSETALYFIGGILKHAKALAGITNPTTNSYKRLVPGYEAPVNLAYSARNRSAAIRIPMYSHNPKAKRIEIRFPDPSCNPYLAFAALLMAGIDGIQNKIHPGEPLDKNIYDLPAEELSKIENTPRTLREALEELRKDHEFLLKGDVFTKDVIETWIEYKLENEAAPVELRPHPHEFFLYYDI
ncbi:MAG TPA: type I glutamate--ammonia ligase [Spirochaetota bacterium]|nr:type I glutamate--ammonia ligase [Spirochaetota bacterium]HOM38491.1 type I glutamate--ammonia ligase [Spirochaetota bacterium]HPQ49031.1 type I glutamate--ammonia ligase [Spirochaetota bacterium]